jgi:dihydroflavonol-4-reductase
VKLLILGGNGFLGHAVVACASDRGHEVIVPPGESGAHLASEPDLLELAAGDARQRQALVEAARDVDAIVATEPLSRYVPPRVIPMVEASLQRARLALEAASHGGAKRLVWVGSALAVGSSVLKTTRCTEHDWTLGKSDARVRAQVESEQWLAREAKSRGVPLIRVLPTRVLGPGSPEPARDLKLVRAYARWRVGLFAHGGLNVVDVRDAALAVVRATEIGSDGARYLMGGHDLTYKAFYREIAAAIGARHLHLAVPRGLALAVFGAVEGTSLLLGRSAPLDRNFVDLHFGRYAFYDSSAAHAALGAVPRPIADTMAASVADLRAARLVG